MSCESGNCSIEISSLPLISTCPQDESWLFGGNFPGGQGSSLYGRVSWERIKDCIAAANNPPDDIYFVVAASGGLINPGGQVFTLPSTFQDWKIRLVRNNIPTDFEEQISGDPYFTYDVSTRVVTIVPDASLQDKFMVQAYKLST